MFNKKIALIAGGIMTAASVAGVAFFSHRKMEKADTYDEIGGWLRHYGKGHNLANICNLTDNELASEKEKALHFMEKLESIDDVDSANVALGVQVVLLWIDAALDKRAEDQKEEKEA